MVQILLLLYKVLDFYKWILIARILLSWAPMIGLNIDFYKPPFSWVHAATEPAFRPFRGLLTFGMIDFSPILLFFGLELLQSALGQLINSMLGF